MMDSNTLASDLKTINDMDKDIRVLKARIEFEAIKAKSAKRRQD